MKHSIVLRGTGIGIHDLIANANETGALGTILQVIDRIAFFAGDRLPWKLPPVVRIAGE